MISGKNEETLQALYTLQCDSTKELLRPTPGGVSRPDVQGKVVDQSLTPLELSLRQESADAFEQIRLNADQIPLHNVFNPLSNSSLSFDKRKKAIEAIERKQDAKQDSIDQTFALLFEDIELALQKELPQVKIKPIMNDLIRIIETRDKAAIKRLLAND